MPTGTIEPLGLPLWSREAAIGDYDGATDKEDSLYEGEEPYAAMHLRSLHDMRGSAYTTERSTLVDAENVALARHFAAVWSRNPEKLRANAIPARADERLPYWAKALAIPSRPSDPRWRIRQLCASHFSAASTPTIGNVKAAVAALLGDAFVDVRVTLGPDLATPPSNTYWPGINPGPASYDMGGGTWTAKRSHVFVEVRQPVGMPDSDFRELMDVQLFQLLDRWLPAHATFNWATSDGFRLGVSRLGFDGLGE
jgi:hypothetical protein